MRGKFTPQMMSYNSFNPTEVTKAYLNNQLGPSSKKKIIQRLCQYHDAPNLVL
jgi:hypothetical protein